MRRGFLQSLTLTAAIGVALALTGSFITRAATKAVDLDGDGVAESTVALNVLSTFPAKVECVVTNKSVGHAFSFDWASAGPGGFTGILAPGTAAGVGTKWTWQTSQAIYSYTGSACSNDICFVPAVEISSSNPGGGAPPPDDNGRLMTTIDGSSSPKRQGAGGAGGKFNFSGGSLAQTSSSGSTATSTSSSIRVESTSTTSDIGPFSVPGRSLTTSGVTISTASLTSSLITFFSPPKVVFSATSTAGQQGSGQISYNTTMANNTNTVLTASVEPGPPGCCPDENQLNCNGSCVNYLSDPHNCGGCGTGCNIAIGEVCDAGTCRIICPEGYDLCGQTCVNFSGDVNNCGACYHQCDASLKEYCQDGTCHDFCPAGQTLCGEDCFDLDTDVNNCGACGNACDASLKQSCEAGVCVDYCPAGYTLCGDDCFDLATDVGNCGACGESCDTALLEYCQDSTCHDFCSAGLSLCGDACFDLNTDASNCGACGHACDASLREYCLGGSCQAYCPAGYDICGDSCADLTSDPLNCGACGHACGANQICTDSACVTCTSPNQTACDNRCTNIHTDPLNCGYCGHDCNFECPSTGQGTCSQGNSCVCTSSATLASASLLGASTTLLPPPAPVCETQGSTVTLPAGQSQTLPCSSASYLAKELLTFVNVCEGGGAPDSFGTCPDGSRASRGPFIRLVPDLSRPVGIAPVALSPVAVSVVEPGGDGLWEPGETAQINISVGNAGFATITGACASLSSPSQDITPEDGIDNPTQVNLIGSTACYPDIPGTPTGTTDCALPSLAAPVSALTPFTVQLPAGYVGDTSRQFLLHVTGTANGDPVSVDVPVTLGIAGNCDAASLNGDFDGLVGLDSPMAPLIPEDDPRPLPFPNKPFSLGKTRPMKLSLSCGGVNLDDTDVLAPKIVGLFNLTTNQPENLSLININDSPNASDPFFRFNSSSAGWIYNMRTKDLTAARYRLTIQVGGRKNYVSGFELH